jgi:hypothetical protein
MTWRQRILWTLSALMLVWIGIMTLSQYRAIECADTGGRWTVLRWECVPARRILLERGLYRS